MIGALCACAMLLLYDYTPDTGKHLSSLATYQQSAEGMIADMRLRTRDPVSSA